MRDERWMMDEKWIMNKKLNKNKKERMDGEMDKQMKIHNMDG